MKNLLLLCLLPICSSAQPVIDRPRDGLKILYENDYFTATDYYYTQGIRITYLSSRISGSPLFALHRIFGNTDAGHAGFFIVQEGFTPTSIRRDTIITGDRPFAGCLYAGHQVYTDFPEHQISLRSEVQLGVMGPASGGPETQGFIHRTIGNIEPEGWQFQMKNEPVINLNIELEKILLSSSFLEASATAGAKAGTFRNELLLGFKGRAGLINRMFGAKNKRAVEIYVFAGIQTALVAHNATLQGGMLRDDHPYVIASGNIGRNVQKARAGLVFDYRRFALGYAINRLSPEFEGGKKHAWGTCELVVRF